MEDAPKKFFRLSVGREVRLRFAYYITCTDVIKDENGEIVELRCSYDPESKGGNTADGRKVKGTLHWVSAKHAVKATVNLYDHLFSERDVGDNYKESLNPKSLEVLGECYLEPSLEEAPEEVRYQFERLGYFCRDITQEDLVFDRIVSLRDTWAKIKNKG